MNFKKGFLEIGKQELEFLNLDLENNIVTMKENKPPFMIVYKEIENIILTDIPLYLLYVEVETKADNSMFSVDAPHQRVLKAKILKKHEIHELFGEYGISILKYLENLKTLNYDKILELQKRCDSSMEVLYKEVLKNYRESLDGIYKEIGTPNKCFDLVTYIVFSLGKQNDHLILLEKGYALTVAYEEALTVIKNDLLKLCHII